MPRDIRELRDDPAAYAAELRRRWGALLSYRYLGRTYSSMDLGPADDTVTLRHARCGNAAGGILLSVLGIVSPEGGGMSDLEAVPNPVIHSCQVLDPGRDVGRVEIVSEVLKRGRQMGYSRSRIVDADDPARGPGPHRGAGHHPRRATRGAREDDGRADRGRRRPGPAAPLAGLRRRPPARRPLGTPGACPPRSPRPTRLCTSARSSSSSRPPPLDLAAVTAGTDLLRGSPRT